MKLIFLDIDGVLNNDAFWGARRESKIEKSWKEPGISEEEGLIRFHVGMINPKKVELLNVITDATGAKIVISSSWRGTPHLKEILSRAGVTADVIAQTPSALSGSISTPGYGSVYVHSLRGLEILAYLDKQHPYVDDYHGEPDGTWRIPRTNLESYLILDDDGDMLWWQRNNFVNTDGHRGLTKRDVNKAVKILGATHVINP